jgi:hypothetical protein
MKLFGRTINFGKAPIKEQFKGYVDVGTGQKSGPHKFNLGDHSWSERCKYYDNLCDTEPLAKSIAMTIAGQLMAEGMFIVENDLIHDESGGRAKDAAEEIEQLKEDIKLETQVYDSTINCVKHGTVFFETAKTPRWDMRIIPFQENIAPQHQTGEGTIDVWHQLNSSMQENAAWTTDSEQDNYIIPVSWNVTSRSWPYGTSLYAGLDSEFRTLSQLKTDIAEYMHNNAFPMEIYAVGNGEFTPQDTDLATIRSIVKVTQPGQKIITSYPIDHKVGGTGDREVKGMDTVLNFVKEELVDGGGIPPISRQWNSTQASAKEMMPWTLANYIKPLQRTYAVIFQEYLFKPYLESLGYSRRLCPRLMFSPPDSHKMDDATYWKAFIDAGLPPQYAWEELGFDLEHIRELQEENDKRQEEQMKLQASLNPQPNKPEDKPAPTKDKVEEWTVSRKKPTPSSAS